MWILDPVPCRFTLEEEEWQMVIILIILCILKNEGWDMKWT